MASSSDFLRQVYAWMFLGMLLSAGAAFMTLYVPGVPEFIFGSDIVYLGLLVIEFVLVVILAALVTKLPAPVAGFLFIVYSIITGMTLSALFFVYTTASIFIVFVVASGMFGAMSVYGFVTKRDLTGMGSFLFMLLIGIVLAGLVNLFLNNSVLSLITSVLGVVVFTGLTAYDVQRIKKIGEQFGNAGGAYAVSGALSLYLDYINLFISLLSLFGKRRE